MRFRFAMVVVAILGFTGRWSLAADKPNLMMFIADDLTWTDCAPFGGKGPGMTPTPNMERVMKAGMSFNSAFVASPSCAPSRASLLTSMYPMQTGAMFNQIAPKRELKKWPAYFRDIGYEVVAIGKVAHYNQVRQYGFDFVSNFNYHQDDCVNVAVQWLKDRRARADSGEKVKPLCILVGTNWPHVPWPKNGLGNPADMPIASRMVDTPETRVAITRYHAAVANADRDLGKAYDAAKETLGEDTLFAFSSDHGAQFPGGKWNCYDQGTRVPLYVVWPGKIAAGATTNALVSWIDLMPTFIDVVGGTPPESGLGAGQIAGRSFLNVLTGKAETHREFVFTTHSGDPRMNQYPQRAVRTKQYKYLRNLDSESEYHSHVDKVAAEGAGSYFPTWLEKAKTDPTAAKIVQAYFKRPAEELYDVVADPYETKNLAADPALSTTKAELRAELDAWMKSLGDEGLKTERVLQDKYVNRNQNAEGGEKPERADPPSPAAGTAPSK